MSNGHQASSEVVVEGGRPAVKRVVRLLIEQFENVTLLAVCPNSKAVTRAALAAAKEAGAPLLFAATLNQVDRDGGYTGWTPRAFVDFVENEKERIGLEAPVWPCLDHGGPWLKGTHATAGLSFEETMAEVKSSLEACLDAGYALLHLDPAADRPFDDLPSVEEAVHRTLDLLAHAEGYRREKNYPPVSYEVGSEEAYGTESEALDRFLDGVDAGLQERGLEATWPCFAVGKIGADRRSGTFDPDAAYLLTEKIRPYGALLKGHRTDHAAHPEAYPIVGMGGANVGPELTEVEYHALADLASFERELGMDSDLEGILRHAVVQSGRWKKWLDPGEEEKPFDALPEERQERLVATGSRYVWTLPDVVEARARLYDNLRPYRDAEAFVHWRIKTAILRYFHAFNLVGFSERLTAVGA